MKIGELFVELGVHSDTQKINEFVSSMRRGVLESVAFVAGLVGISLVFKDILTGAIDTARSLRTFRNTTGESTEELQRWQIAAEKFGVTAQAMQSGISQFAKTLSQVRHGLISMPAGFKIFGVDPDASVFENLIRIRSIIKKEYKDRPARATTLLQSLGISPEMMNFLTLPEKKFKGAFPTGDEYSYFREQQENILKLDAQIIEIRRIWTKLSVDLLSLAVPNFKRIATGLNIITEGLLKLIGVITKSRGWVDVTYDKLMKSASLNDSWLYRKFVSGEKGISAVNNSSTTVNVTIHGTGDQTGDKEVLTQNIKNAIEQLELVR